MSSAFVGRQPIYSPDLQIAGYEVLFRDSEQNSANIVDGDQATADMLFSLLTEFGLDTIVGDSPAFINVTRNFILDGHAFFLPKDRVVLEVLEDIQPEPEIIAALRNLSDHGYTIALDDFVYSPRLQPLVEIADIIKVELPAISREDLPHHVKQLRRNDVRLLAEKVETYDDFENCKQLGFDYFQGYFFCKPKVIQGKKIAVSRVAALRLLCEMRDSNVQMETLTRIVSTEPSLCYKLLRYVNSSGCGLLRPIDSVQSAITFVGLRRLQAFTRLALLTKLAEGKPAHLLVTSLTRARMCELLAQQANRHLPEMYFVAGLFTVLDALLDLSMAEALESLPLEVEIHEALLNRTGPMSDIVQCVVNYDQATFDVVEVEGLNSDAIRAAYFDALAWTTELSVSAAEMM